MILSAVVIVLRETLEAALLISLLLALGFRCGFRHGWVLISLALGVVGAALYATFLAEISMAFGGVGQEITNACLHGLIVISLFLVALKGFYSANIESLTIFMIVSVWAAIVREGSEIWIYYLGFLPDGETFSTASLGGGIGLSIGLSVGALLYYGLVLAPERWYRALALSLFALVAAGMLAQAVNALIQADIISGGLPVWDISMYLPESSVLGQLLYALIGYQAQPSWYELLAYLFVLSAYGLIGVIANWFSPRPIKEVV